MTGTSLWWLRSSFAGCVFLKRRIPGIDIIAGEAKVAADLVSFRPKAVDAPPVDCLLRDLELVSKVFRSQPPGITHRRCHGHHLLLLQVLQTIDAASLPGDCIDCR